MNCIDPRGTDAIYIADCTSNGLPVVGHAILLLQDENGKWYRTEFSGSSKENATVSVEEIKKDIFTYCNEEFNSLLHFGVYIEGDFSKGYQYAKKYEYSNYGGYNLVFNNCLHYARNVLRQGQAESVIVDACINLSYTIVPVSFCDELTFYSLFGSYKNEVKKSVSEWVNSLSSQIEEKNINYGVENSDEESIEIITLENNNTTGEKNEKKSVKEKKREIMEKKYLRYSMVNLEE